MERIGHWYFIAFGLALFGGQIIALLRGWRAQRWPTVVGVVEQAKAEWSGVMARGTHPRVRYRYTVNGIDYLGDTVRFGASVGRTTETAALAAVGGLACGAPVVVYHDPRRPNVSVLQPSPRWDDFVVMAIGVVCLAIGFLT